MLTEKDEQFFFKRLPFGREVVIGIPFDVVGVRAEGSEFATVFNPG